MIARYGMPSMIARSQPVHIDADPPADLLADLLQLPVAFRPSPSRLANFSYQANSFSCFEQDSAATIVESAGVRQAA